MSAKDTKTVHSGDQYVLQWKVGLINRAGKYLTAEPFGFKLNASGQLLKKRQTWTLEQDNQDQAVYLKSHLGCYISVDKYGKVTCDKKADKLNRCDKFIVEYAKDGSGRWAFKNLEHNYYFGGLDENIQCFSKTITDTEWWIIHLAIHPLVSIRNVNRKRYAVLNDDEVQCKEVIPWGEARLFIMHFAEGKYSLKTCDNRFLHRNGTLVNELEKDARFTLEIRYDVIGGFAVKDCKGFYLTAAGPTATLKGGKHTSVGKDELFVFEICHPQVIITSQNIRKLVSVKQGVDLSANQSEVCEKSTFQMELDKHSHKWAFRTSVDNKYWSLESFGGIQAASTSVSAKSLFDVESNGDGTVCIKASNGNYLYNKQTGSILSNMENPDSKNFIIRMVNRPFFILKCDFGFVALKSDTAQKPELVCNKASYEPTFIEAQEDGYYFLKGKNNKYWTVADDNSIHADGDTPSCKFLLEFHDLSQLTIKAPNGKYLKGEQNSFLAKGEEVDVTTVWEY